MNEFEDYGQQFEEIPDELLSQLAEEYAEREAYEEELRNSEDTEYWKFLECLTDDDYPF